MASVIFKHRTHAKPTTLKTVCKDTVGNFKGVVSCRQTLGVIPLRDSSVQLSEIWQGRPPHPNQEILIDEAVVSRVRGVQLVSRSGPKQGFHRTWKSNCVWAIIFFFLDITFTNNYSNIVLLYKIFMADWELFDKHSKSSSWQSRRQATINLTSGATVESVPQRCNRGVSIFHVVVSPPGNPFPIEGHLLLCPIDDLIQLEGVFKKKKTRKNKNLNTANTLHHRCVIFPYVPLNMLFATDPHGTIGLLLLSYS